MSVIFYNKGGRGRQLLLPAECAHPGRGEIKTVEALRQHLQTAIELEHATIPVYLCALYSLDEQRNTFSYQVLQGIVMEEMLHMILAANILNAIGGAPAIDHPEFIPQYPTFLPHSDESFVVPLQGFSQAAVDVFLKIEQPALASAPPEADRYHTIGQFYHAIQYALTHLNRSTPDGIFTGDSRRQLSAQHYYGGGGKLVAVHGIEDARLAINEIVGQGEGIHDEIVDSDHALFGEEIEYAHYFRFNEIRQEQRYCPKDSARQPPSGPRVQVDWHAALNMRPNPKMADYEPGSSLWQLSESFNRSYMSLLTQIHLACNGAPEQLMQAIPLMYDLKYKAKQLMNIPVGNGQMAGPSFEYLAPAAAAAI
jgi:hypothetical protein